MTLRKRFAPQLAAVVCLCAPISAIQAAEGFQVRYNLAGTLGAEMFNPDRGSGFWGGLTWTEGRIRKVTGNDGEPLRLGIPSGLVPLPPPAPAATYPPSQALVDGTGRLQQANLRFGWVAAGSGPDRLAFGVNLPYVHRKSQQTRLSGAAPDLAFAPGVPQPLRAAATAQWRNQYAQGLDARSALESGEVSGWGDLELQAAWVRNTERLRLVASAAWVLPTGGYDPAAGPDVSLGNFHTLRPAVEASWAATSVVRVGGRATLGLNTRNRDNDQRSGHWAGLEVAGGWQMGWGVLGVQVLRVQQFRDDEGGALGANRYSNTAAGAFLATPVPVLDATISLQHTASITSRNARHGQFTQVRLSRRF